MTLDEKRRILLRPATPEDEAFLFAVFASTRPDIGLMGLELQQEETLLQQQYEARRATYVAKYPNARYEIIEIDNEKAGVLCTDFSSERIQLVDIALVPCYRSHGTGEYLIRRLIDAAREHDSNLRLHVLMGNPAQRLYERLGFVITETAPPYLGMEWRKQPDKD